MDKVILNSDSDHDYDSIINYGLPLSTNNSGIIAFDNVTFAFTIGLKCTQCNRYWGLLDLQKINTKVLTCGSCANRWEIILSLNLQEDRDKALIKLREALKSINDARKLWSWHKLGI